MSEAPDPPQKPSAETASRLTHLRIGKHRIPIPRSKFARMALGVFLIIFSSIPILPPGPGGVAVGFALLSIDNPQLRRPRRRMVVWGGRLLNRLFQRRPASP